MTLPQRSLLEWGPDDQKRNNFIIKINSNNEFNPLNKIASGKSLQIHIKQLMGISKFDEEWDIYHFKLSCHQVCINDKG